MSPSGVLDLLGSAEEGRNTKVPPYQVVLMTVALGLSHSSTFCCSWVCLCTIIGPSYLTGYNLVIINI